MNHRNRKQWIDFIRKHRNARTGVQLRKCLHTDAEGWEWACVHSNASHQFYVGHSADFEQFADMSQGDEWPDDSNPEPELAVRVYRQRSELAMNWAE
jgi:hypothetical protein